MACLRLRLIPFFAVAMLAAACGGATPATQAPIPTPATQVPTPTPSGALVGQPAPAFTLASAQGTQVSLASYAGSKHVVVLFYRGFF